jgi:hypothetical protein
MRRTLIIIACALLALVMLVTCFGILTSSSNPDGSASIETPDVGAAVGSAGAEAARGAKPAPSKTGIGAPTRTPKPVATIKGDDLVHVGEDVPAGTYRAIDPIGDGPFDYCFWTKSRDAEGSDIIDIGSPTGGRPQVTVKAGQWFKSQGCPEWRKQ